MRDRHCIKQTLTCEVAFITISLLVKYVVMALYLFAEEEHYQEHIQICHKFANYALHASLVAFFGTMVYAGRIFKAEQRT